MASKLNYITIDLILLTTLCMCSCTKYNYVDGGTANGIHNCSMWEYFESHLTDWDSTMIMIEHAGLKPIFEGKGGYDQISFFGVTSLSIVHFILDHNQKLDDLKDYYGEEVDESEYWHRVTDIPAETCARILKDLIITKRLMLEEVPEGYRTQEGLTNEESGGMVVPTLGRSLFIWTYWEDYGGVEKAGAHQLWIAKQGNGNTDWRVASTNIQTNNGVVHALGYDLQLINF